MHRTRTLTSHATQALAEAGIIAIIVLTLIVAPALAAKGGNAKNSTSSIEVVTVSAGLTALEAAGPSQGGTVTFDVSTTATDRPYVLLNCYQAGTWVLAGQAGFWTDYAFGQNFILASTWWTAGAGNCTAQLGVLNADGTRFRELARTSFDVSE